MPENERRIEKERLKQQKNNAVQVIIQGIFQSIPVVGCLMAFHSHTTGRKIGGLLEAQQQNEERIKELTEALEQGFEEEVTELQMTIDQLTGEIEELRNVQEQLQASQAKVDQLKLQLGALDAQEPQTEEEMEEKISADSQDDSTDASSTDASDTADARENYSPIGTQLEQDEDEVKEAKDQSIQDQSTQLPASPELYAHQDTSALSELSNQEVDMSQETQVPEIPVQETPSTQHEASNAA
jgi:DNA repair exonuclease SbcCD ATPase subunit